MSLRGIKMLYKVHAWVGLISGALLIVITASGALAVFKPEIDRLANPSLLTVAPAGPRKTWDEILARVRARYPGAEVVALSVPGAADEPCGILLRRGKGGLLQVGADPYTGRVLGDRRPSGTLADTARQFHVRLLMGFWGRVFVGGFGLVLLAATATGLWIYAPMNKRSWTPRLRRGLGTRALLADLHRVVGLSALAFNLIFAVTGAVLGLENLKTYVERRSPAAASPDRPNRALQLPRTGLIEQGLSLARRQFPDRRPSRVLIERGGRFRVLLNHPDRQLIAENSSFLRFDSRTGSVLAVHDAARAGFWLRVYLTMEPLHFGRFGGLPVRLLYVLMGLATGFLSISGYLIYVIRTRSGSRKVAGGRARSAVPAASL